MSADGLSCNPCPNSYYKDAFGAQSCTRCPAHAMHGLTGQTTVDVCYCEQGYLWDSVAKTCNICPENTFNNRANESQCFDCVSNGVESNTDNPMIPNNIFRIRCVCGVCSTTYPIGFKLGLFEDYSHITVTSEALQWNFDYNRAWNDLSYKIHTLTDPIKFQYRIGGDLCQQLCQKNC